MIWTSGMTAKPGIILNVQLFDPCKYVTKKTMKISFDSDAYLKRYIEYLKILLSENSVASTWWIVIEF